MGIWKYDSWSCLSWIYNILLHKKHHFRCSSGLSVCSKRDTFPSSSTCRTSNTFCGTLSHKRDPLPAQKVFRIRDSGWKRPVRSSSPTFKLILVEFWARSVWMWIFGSPSRSGHPSVCPGGIKREKCRTKEGWQLHLRPGVSAQPVLYLQTWKSVWIYCPLIQYSSDTTSFSKAAREHWKDNYPCLEGLLWLIAHSPFSPCLCSRDFCLDSKTWGEALPPLQKTVQCCSLWELQEKTSILD